MALSIPITITLGTLVSILVAAGRGGIDVASLTIDGIDGVKSKYSKTLVDRCSEIAEDLQQMDHHLLITGRTHRLVKTIVDSLKWAQLYEEKCLVKQIIFNSSYKRKFKQFHYDITTYFADLVLSVMLTGLFPDILTNSINKSINLNKN